VLLDPRDDVRVSVGLLERHDPGAGLVVVHPTPGTSSSAAIAHDVLAALGRSVRRLEAERLAAIGPAGRAVTAWLLSDSIEDLIVLRADRLSAASWQWLLQVCRDTGTRLLLVCHVPGVPPALATTLAGTRHQIITDLRRALPRRRHPTREPGTHLVREPVADVVDLPPYAGEDLEGYRRNAPVTIGVQGFLRTDAVFQHGRSAALTWLSDHLSDGGQVLAIAQVQLLLTRLVQDSPTFNHTMARLRGAQAGFRMRGFNLKIPSWTSMFMGQLTGPGLDSSAADLSAAGVERIRAGVAHPTIGAGIALSLLTGMPILFLHSLPWEALSPDNDVLHLTWFDSHATLCPSPHRFPRTHPRHGRAPLTAVFPIPAAVRPLLQTVRYLAELHPVNGRLFATTGFTFERIAPAAAHCGITLPPYNRLASLRQVWQSWVTCTYTPGLGGESDTHFAQDQVFTLSPAQIKIMERAEESEPARAVDAGPLPAPPFPQDEHRALQAAADRCKPVAGDDLPDRVGETLDDLDHDGTRLSNEPADQLLEVGGRGGLVL